MKSGRQTGTSCPCACPKSGVLWSVVYGSSFDLLINSPKLILCGVRHEYTVWFRQGNSELASWCGFPLYWRSCFDLWVICCFVERGYCRCHSIHLFSPMCYLCTKFAMSKDACCMWVLMLPPEKHYLMSRLQRLNIRHRRDKKKPVNERECRSKLSF